MQFSPGTHKLKKLQQISKECYGFRPQYMARLKEVLTKSHNINGQSYRIKYSTQ